MNNLLLRSLGSIAVIVTISGNIPQIIKIWKTKKATDISIHGLSLKMFGKILMLIYAFIFSLWELFLPNIISFLLTLILFVMKIYYHQNQEHIPLQEEDALNM